MPVFCVKPKVISESFPENSQLLTYDHFKKYKAQFHVQRVTPKVVDYCGTIVSWTYDKLIIIMPKVSKYSQSAMKSSIFGQ
jgi:hypothetical protein